MIFLDRIQKVKNSTSKPDSVLYWMQGAFRTHYNYSLEFAIRMAKEYKLPLTVLIIVDFSYPEANARTMKFFLDGIKDVVDNLKERRIPVHVRRGSFVEVFKSYYEKSSLIVTDKPYLPKTINLHRAVYSNLDAQIYEVDSNLVVPANLSSEKKEAGAYTIRPKILRLLNKFSRDFQMETYNGARIETILEVDLEKQSELTEIMKATSPSPAPYKGGEIEASKVLKEFLETKFHYYSKLRGDPSGDVESNLSPYLHYGHISPVMILKEASKVDTSADNFDSLLEQLVIRRELAHNFTLFSGNLEDLQTILPGWAFKTLLEHQKDQREYLYTVCELEEGKTHDKYWNAAQTELVGRGKIHNYMRMYWGKKIIEWTGSIADAYRTMIYLNNKYALDGRDPNSYAGIAWCFGLHDRPFMERNIFGKVRYMSAKGLERKFEMQKYIERIMKQYAL